MNELVPHRYRCTEIEITMAFGGAGAEGVVEMIAEIFINCVAATTAGPL
jgi:hypothetical protein